jgi:alpha-beta hydrolase superfamily lysophospholipase
MKNRDGLRAVAAITLLLTGFLLTRTSSYREKTVIAAAGGCSMEMDIVEPASGAGQDSVVLFHGLSANKKIMSYLARGFAEQGLRVFVPDFPGHGRTPGPFTPARVEECAESLLRGLSARGTIDPQRTVLAGHSMGAVIALRVAARVRVAGVIAISPAPTRPAHGVSPEMLLFQDAAPLPANALVLSGGLEPESMRGSAKDLWTSRMDSPGKAGIFDVAATREDSGIANYYVIPRATHVSLLFTPATVALSQEWTARLLHLANPVRLPSLRGLMGCFLGLAGLLLLAGPFLREVLGKRRMDESTAAGRHIPFLRLFLEIISVSLLVVLLLRFWLPLRFLHVFEGDYLASFFLLAGILLLLLHYREARAALAVKAAPLLGAVFSGLIIFLLTTGWIDLTATESWLSASRWLRFPVVFIAVFAFCLAMEVVLGPIAVRSGWRRLTMALALLLVVWLVLVGGVFYLHTGEILLGLLAPYFALLFVFQRMGSDLVRRETCSAAAAGAFGAILWAGFCLALFPVS